MPTTSSPGRDDGDGITPHRPDEELRATLAGADADIVLAGHTHQPTDRRVGTTRAVNGGSVSNPITDDLRASSVIIHADGHGHHLEHRRVPYDRDSFLRRASASGHPAHDYIASFQLGEQFRYPIQPHPRARRSSGHQITDRTRPPPHESAGQLAWWVEWWLW